MKTELVLLGLLALLGGCATPRLATESGRPEVLLNGSETEVQSAVINHFRNKGWQPIAGSRLTMLLEKQASVAATASNRIRITLIPMEGNVRVIGAFQHEDELDRRGNQELQTELEGVKLEMANKIGTAVAPKP